VTVVPIKDLHANAIVDAEFYDRVDVSFAKRADDAWSTYLAQARSAALAAGLPFADPEHAHWEWEKKVRYTNRLLSYQTMGIQCDGQVQGLILFVTDGFFGRLPAQLNLPLTYVHLLGTAPWNLEEVVDKPKFAGVGTVLLRAAVETSVDLGFKGRIGLHSLPKAEHWYDRRGLTCLGLDAAKRMKYYEMTELQAAAFIR
jgi:hypothetical protein